MSHRNEIPPCTSAVNAESVDFAIWVIDSSGIGEELETLLKRRTGRPRTLPVRPLLVALLLLAIDDRPLHLKAATRLLWRQLPKGSCERLNIAGEARTKKSFLARYRQVRYLFHSMLETMDPSLLQKNRVMDQEMAVKRRRKLTTAEIDERKARLESVIASLIDASIRVCSRAELDNFDGSVGLDATPVPLFSRGPSRHTGRSASDPDGGWYVREGDHREIEGPGGRKLRKLFWALEATIVTMGRPPGSVPAHPNLILGVTLARPGEDPGGTGVRLLASIRRRGYPAGYLGADRGYTQVIAERFHLPVRALGYRLVMDYKAQDLGIQANSGGAVMVDGAFYCPGMPDALVQASSQWRAGIIGEALSKTRIAARAPWRLVRKEGPDADGYERWSCPAQGDHPQLCCPLRPSSLTAGLGRIPVLFPPDSPPKLCTQTAVTIAPDVGARHRQELAFGTEEWSATYACYRNTIEGLNGYVKDAAHEALSAPSRRRVRGIAAQSLFCAFLLMAANIRKIRAYRELVFEQRSAVVAERARRRRTSLADYRASP